MNISLKERLLNAEKKNVVVYGDSLDKSLLKELADFQIYYMDLEIDMMESGKRGISLEQAAKYHVDTFILLKQLISRQDIFLQLLEYCKTYQADVYDRRGRNISESCIKAMETHCCDENTLLQEIEKHIYISFDIFDTLLTRTVLLPEDVFEMVSQRMHKSGVKIKNFKEKRIKAQESLGLSNPNIYEIYDRLKKKYKIKDEIANLYRDMEITVETEVLIPRADMLEIYNKCIDLGKRVSLVSDMYLPVSVMEPILKRNGIENYEKIFISCDSKQLKLEGLLEIYKEQTAGEKYLHIGDHIIHDGICAELAGIDYCLVLSGFKMAKKTKLKECIQKAVSLEEHIILGIVIAKVFNSPFKNTDNEIIKIDSDYEYGFAFCAPLITQFVLWLYRQIKESKFEDILFASRDGYLIQIMYNMLLNVRKDNTMPRGIYFYTSRKAAVMPCIDNEAYINMIIDISYDMPPQKMMKERFGLPENQVLKYDANKYKIVHSYVWEHAQAIFKRANEAKINYFKYMGELNLRIGKKYAFMDFVSSGTCQKSLMKIVPFEIKGLYAGWNGDESKEKIGVSSLFEDKNTFFMKKYKIMETFMTSEEPSLSHFNKKGKPVFSKQDRSERELEYVRQMQQACIDFFKKFITEIEPEDKHISNDFIDSLFAMCDSVLVSKVESELNHLSLMDDWKQKRNKLNKLI